MNAGKHSDLLRQEDDSQHETQPYEIRHPPAPFADAARDAARPEAADSGTNSDTVPDRRSRDGTSERRKRQRCSGEGENDAHEEAACIDLTGDGGEGGRLACGEESGAASAVPAAAAAAAQEAEHEGDGEGDGDSQKSSDTLDSLQLLELLRKVKRRRRDRVVPSGAQHATSAQPAAAAAAAHASVAIGAGTAAAEGGHGSLMPSGNEDGLLSLLSGGVDAAPPRLETLHKEGCDGEGGQGGDGAGG
ncbi:unnamed protein product [Vitrella brassicaformis CCMP3155]|uniref:Uncharacterized protein n=2 Tax=Vitrella brassicaformis TaxID=1169539 RepID=A0A0G4EGW3_VITBC|nr:unnamed protein product [Vitrella brassicaformis CCMP3155]|eukprot:CEL94713.1 unnamed protein product [Vitrella brassicaformis CCMP3155]